MQPVSTGPLVEEITLNYNKFTLITVFRNIDEKHQIPIQMSLSGHKHTDDKIRRVADTLNRCDISKLQ